jgi:hypothetical protein
MNPILKSPYFVIIIILLILSAIVARLYRPLDTVAMGRING